MIEETLQNFLAGKLSVPVWLEVPVKPPESFVVLEKTGSGYEDGIYSATFAIQSYAPSLYQAARLNHQVKGAMKTITELDEVASCDLNSDYNFTDTASKRYRYQAVFDLIHYED